VILRRLGIAAYQWNQPDDSWRKWAYDEAKALGVTGLTGVTLVFVPLAVDRRYVLNATTYWPTVEQIIDGLIGARVIADRSPRSVTLVTLSPSDVVGVNGLEVQILTAADLAPPDLAPARQLRAVRSP
jgi:hypothetical protein